MEQQEAMIKTLSEKVEAAKQLQMFEAKERSIHENMSIREKVYSHWSAFDIDGSNSFDLQEIEWHFLKFHLYRDSLNKI